MESFDNLSVFEPRIFLGDLIGMSEVWEKV